MYSTIRTCSLTAHVFDHDNDKVLCGINRWHKVPFKINKTKYDHVDMLKKHLAFAERRGGPNPYKFTCMKCKRMLELMQWSEGPCISIIDQTAKCYGVLKEDI